MADEALQRALSAYKKLKIAKQEVARLEKEIEPLKNNIKDAMSIAGLKLIENELGYAKWVDRKGVMKWDTEMLEEELGDRVDEFRTMGESSQFVKFGLYEMEDEE
jgi:hypothetical protein